MRSLKETLSHDALASVVVFLIAVPLCMGIAVASGVPPAAGLLTGIIGGIVVGALSGAPLQVSGPAAGLTVLVWDIVQQHGLSALGPVLILAGLLQIVAGALRVGQWFRAISPAVVHGMLAGIGVLILASQFHVMVDDKPRANGLQNLISIPASVVKALTPDQGLAHNEAAILGLLTIATMALWAKFATGKWKMIPGALIGAALATTIARSFSMPVQYVNIPDSLLGSVQLPTAASLGGLLSASTLGAACVLAFVASAETLLSAVAVDRMHTGPRANYSRELIAQGIGNMLCGVVGALPMTGVIVRGSANVQAGARSRMATIMHGGLLLIAVVSLPGVLRLMPVCVLAAILVYTGFKLIDKKHISHLRSYGRMPLVIYVATLSGIVLTDLLTGVLIGLGLSLAKLLYKVTHLSVRVERQCEGRVDLHLNGAATFLSLPKLAAALESLPHGSELHLHCEHLVYIDHSCLDLLEHWREQHAKAGRPVVLEWDHLLERFRQPMSRAQQAAA